MDCSLHGPQPSTPGLEIRPSLEGDARELAPYLRHADVAELEALGTAPFNALDMGFANSERCLTLTERGIPIAMFGVGRAGSIWLLGSDRMYANRSQIARISRPWVQALIGDRAYVGNYVHTANTAHVRWLVWCGAQLGDPEPIGINDETFYPFSIPCVTPQSS